MQKTNRKLLPYPVILAATMGDTEAIQTVLRHYAGYIRTLSTRHVYDEYGNLHYVVDETMCRELENHLTKVIVEKFRAVPDE